MKQINSIGIIFTVAGSSSVGFAGDGGPAIAAALYAPYAVAVSSNGDVFIADSGNSRIRRVRPFDLAVFFWPCELLLFETILSPASPVDLAQYVGHYDSNAIQKTH